MVFAFRYVTCLLSGALPREARGENEDAFCAMIFSVLTDVVFG